MRIRLFLFGALSAVALIPIIFFGIWPHSKALQHEIDEVSDRHLLLAKNLGYALQRYDRDVRTIFRLIARNTIAGIELENAEHLVKGLHFRHICIASRKDPAVLHSALATNRPCPDKIPAARYQMFLDLAEEGRVNYSTVLAGPDGEPMLYLVELIDDYVAVGAIATTYFVEFGKAVAFGKGGHAAIVDHTGRLLAHPLPDWHRSMKDISAVPPVQRMLQGETGISQFYSPAAQADMIAGFTTVPETGWGVMIPQPFAELQNKAAAVRNHALGVILLGLLVAAVVSWFVAGLITKPIRSVAAAARAMAGGDETARVETSPSPRLKELSDLASAFNRMASSVEQALHNENEARLGAEATSEALRESHERFRAVVENSAAALVLLTAAGCLRLANRRFEEWFGLAADAFGERPVWEVFDKEVALLFEAQASDVLRMKGPTEKEYDFRFADGTVHCLAVTMFPVPDLEGDSNSIGAVLVDVSEQRSTEERLRRSQKLEAVGQLTGGVAHDFNNLLTIIMGHGEMLARDGNSDLGSAQAIVRAAKRGADLTQRLLAYARKQTLRPKAMDVGRLISDMKDLFARTFGVDIEIVGDASPELWPALADAGQLESALLNLGLNARDSMPAGGRIEILARNVVIDAPEAAEKEIAPGRYVALTVRDTGRGIPEESLPRVFEPFFTTKEVGEGSGLGLSMVYGFVRQSGGQVTIESEEDEGTAVSIYLPAATGRPCEREAPRAPAVHKGMGARALVLEDEPEVLALVRQLFQRLGYEVVGAGCGKDALAILEAGERIDLMLCDVILPGGLDGIDVGMQAKALRSDLKVLFMSGYVQADMLQHRGLVDGFHMIAKPFTLAELTEKLEEVWKSSAASSPEGRPSDQPHQ